MLSPENLPNNPPTPVSGALLHKLKWEATINGRKTANGARYGMSIAGSVTASDEDNTVYDLIHKIADCLEDNNPEMELPDSFRITLFPPNEL